MSSVQYSVRERLTFFLSAAKASSSAASETDKLPVGAGACDMSEKCVMECRLRDLFVDSVLN
jgi:hypothetical protein